MASLDVRERNCLRHHFVDGLTTTKRFGRCTACTSRPRRARFEQRAPRYQAHAQQLPQLAMLSPVEVDSIIGYCAARST